MDKSVAYESEYDMITDSPRRELLSSLAGAKGQLKFPANSNGEVDTRFLAAVIAASEANTINVQAELFITQILLRALMRRLSKDDLLAIDEEMQIETEKLKVMLKEAEENRKKEEAKPKLVIPNKNLT